MFKIFLGIICALKVFLTIQRSSHWLIYLEKLKIILPSLGPNSAHSLPSSQPGRKSVLPPWRYSTPSSSSSRLSPVPCTVPPIPFQNPTSPLLLFPNWLREWNPLNLLFLFPKKSPKFSMGILSNFADQILPFPARTLNFPEFFPSIWARTRAPMAI